MPEPVQLDGASLTIDDVVRVARDARVRVLVDQGARDRLGASRAIVEAAIAAGRTMYGVNTGFGKLANVAIPPDKLDQLQANLIRSHAAGVGDPMPGDVVRGLMLLRANVLLRPTSGVRPALVDGLVGLLNAGLVPLVPEQGSVGASGDLAPLSHVALALIGEGELLTLEEGVPRRVPPGPDSRPPASHPFSLRPRKGSRSSMALRHRPPCWRC